MEWELGTLGGIDRQPRVDRMAQLADSAGEWKRRKGSTGEIYRRSEPLKTFPTRPHISLYPESAGIDDKEDAEAKDEGSSAAPQHRHHQVPMGHQLSPGGCRYLAVFIPSITCTRMDEMTLPPVGDSGGNKIRRLEPTWGYRCGSHLQRHAVPKG